MIATRLSDLDLQLFLSGSLPPGRAFFLRTWTSFSPELRRRLKTLRAQNSDFADREMPGLAARLKLAPSPALPAAIAAPRRPGRPGFAFGLAGAAAMACALFFVFPARGIFPQPEKETESIAATAKGNALGVVLYARGDSTWKIEATRPAILTKDTLQILPLPGNPQHLLLFGWDAEGGFTRLFPGTGDASAPVSPEAPPPAVTLTGLANHVLICVTSASPMRPDRVLRSLRKPPLWPPLQAPHSHLSKGLYFQVFVLRKKSA